MKNRIMKGSASEKKNFSRRDFIKTTAACNNAGAMDGGTGWAAVSGYMGDISAAKY